MHFDGGGGGGEAAFISSGDIAFSGGIPAKYEEIRIGRYSYRSRYVSRYVRYYAMHPISYYLLEE